MCVEKACIFCALKVRGREGRQGEGGRGGREGREEGGQAGRQAGSEEKESGRLPCQVCMKQPRTLFKGSPLNGGVPKNQM